MLAITVGVLAGAFLRLLYAAVRDEWPETYSSVSSALQSHARERLSKYLLVRALPVFLVAVFAAVTADRVHGSARLAVVVMVFVEIMAATGWRSCASYYAVGRRPAEAALSPTTSRSLGWWPRPACLPYRSGPGWREPSPLPTSSPPPFGQGCSRRSWRSPPNAW